MQQSEAGARPVFTSDEAVTYGLAFLASVTGAAAALLTVRSQMLWELVPAAIGVGFAVSWAVRKAGMSEYGWAIVAITAFVGVTGFYGRGIGFWQGIDPELSGMTEEDSLALVLVAIVVLRSYATFSARDALFVAVPGLALYGLLAGENPDAFYALAFLAFVLSTLALASHAHWLEEREEAEMRGVETAHGQQLSAAAGVFVAMVVVALVLVPVLQSMSVRVGRGGFAVGGRLPVTPSVPTTGVSGGTGQTGNAYEVGKGPVAFDNVDEFTVRSKQSAYWRRRTYEIYEGHSWRSDRGRPTVLSTSGLFEMPEPPAGEGRTLLKQTYSFLADRRDLPAAGEPKSFRFVNREYVAADGLQMGDASATLPRPRMLSRGAVVEVVSLVPGAFAPGQEGGRRLPNSETYLQVPFQAQEEVGPQASELTRGMTTPREKAAALEEWVRNHGTYTLDAPAIPSDEDVAAYFVSSSAPEAYCDVFATTLAVMCRTVDIPSRLAVGYSTGRLDRETGEYRVKDSDGHAWAEVYLESEGWVPLEGTPAADSTPAAGTGRGRFARVAARLAQAVLVLAAAGGLLLLVRRRRGRQEGRAPEKTRDETSVLLIALYGRMLRVLARSGLARRACQTPLEYLEHLRAMASAPLGQWLDGFGRMTGDFARVRYGSAQAAPEQVAAARAVVDEGRRELRRARPEIRRILRRQRQQAS